MRRLLAYWLLSMGWMTLVQCVSPARHPFNNQAGGVSSPTASRGHVQHAAAVHTLTPLAGQYGYLILTGASQYGFGDGDTIPEIPRDSAPSALRSARRQCDRYFGGGRFGPRYVVVAIERCSFRYLLTTSNQRWLAATTSPDGELLERIDNFTTAISVTDWCPVARDTAARGYRIRPGLFASVDEIQHCP
jgi:hypothetical protein